MKETKIKMLHLYPDLANLYGDRGNIKILTDYFEEAGPDVDRQTLEPGADWPEEDFDFYYMGSSTDGNFAFLLEDLKRHKAHLAAAIEADRHLLFTGNAIECLGRKVLVEGREEEALGFFDFRILPQKARWKNEALFRTREGRDVLGFQNQAHQMDQSPYPWFQVVRGLGAGGSRMPALPLCEDDRETVGDLGQEGLAYKNLRASYLLGPLLTRNYFLAEDLVGAIMTEKGWEAPVPDHPYDREAYEDFNRILHQPGRQHG